MRRRSMLLGALAAALLLAAGAVAEARGRGSPQVAGVLNVNTATSDELAMLPGIGPTRAEAILARRRQRPFVRREDLRRIPGIGPKTYARIRDHVVVEGATTLRRAEAPPPDTEPAL